MDTRRFPLFLPFVLLFALTALVGACGDDDSTSATPMSTGDGDGDATPMGDGDGTTPTPPPTANPTPNQDGPVRCGARTCQEQGAALPIPLPLPFAPPCCADEATSQCGLVLDGTCTASENDDRCPALTTAFGIDGASCCLEASNTCGLVDSLTGTGDCVSLSEVGGLLGALSNFISIPAPVTCDGQPLMSVPDAGPMGDEDAGVDDDAGTP